MMHRTFDIGTELFSERRLVRFAAPGEAPTPPDVRVDVPAGDIDVGKHKDIHKEASDRMAKYKDGIAVLKKKLDAVAKFHDDVKKSGGTIDARAAKAAGVEDVNADGAVDEVDIDEAKTLLVDQVDDHQKGIDAARGEMATSLSEIKKSGPGGKIDAAFMQLDQAMKNGGSFGETIAAIFAVIKELQDVFKGLTSDSPAKGGPEAGKSGPAGERADVKSMLEDAKKKNPAVDTLPELKAVKATELTTQTAEKTRISGEVATARLGVTAAENRLMLANGLPADDMTREAKIREATVARDGAQNVVKGLEEALAVVEKNIAAIKKDQEKITAVESQGADAVRTFNVSKTAVRAALLSMIDKVTDVGLQADLQKISDVLHGDMNLAANGVDVEFKVQGMPIEDFQKVFIDQGITNTADFDIAPGGGIARNPDALLKGIQRLISNVRAKVDKPANTPAKALKEPVDLEFVETPLSDVIQSLEDAHHVQIEFDRDSLDSIGISTDTPVTRQLKGISLGAALNLILKQVDLTYLVRDEVIQIMSEEHAEMRKAG